MLKQTLMIDVSWDPDSVPLEGDAHRWDWSGLLTSVGVTVKVRGVPEPVAYMPGVIVGVWPSAGDDNAVYLHVGTDFEPDGSDGGPGLRVDLNDAPIYTGVPLTQDRTQS